MFLSILILTLFGCITTSRHPAEYKASFDNTTMPVFNLDAANIGDCWIVEDLNSAETTIDRLSINQKNKHRGTKFLVGEDFNFNETNFSEEALKRIQAKGLQLIQSGECSRIIPGVYGF